VTAGGKTAESATKTALDRLNAIVPTPDLGTSTEFRHWLEAAVAGDFELPAGPLRIVAQAQHLAEEIVANVRPEAYRAAFVDDVLDGATVDDLIERDAAHAAALARWEAREAVLSGCRRVFAGRAGAAFVEYREDLIRNELRAAVDALLADAKAAAAKLKAFAPDYPPALLETANEGELKVWRQSRQTQRAFDSLLTAWRSSWYAASGRGQTVGSEWTPQRAGGWYAWEDPDSITDEALRLGHDGEVLRIAATAPTRYRLLSPNELMPLLAQIDASLPRHAPRNARVLVRRDMVASGA
jgi:hypothetical protein